MSENRLADETSAYLRSAAHQPVHWYPWSEEAFERATREDKPILLDIGAVWCHWCHVLDHESYDDPAVAGIINEHFIPIKVDRDERPDLDARYQHAVSAVSGQGGWPLTGFLTPDGKVFFGGTYFPPVDAFGRPSFTRVLLSVAQYYRESRDEARDAAAQLHRQLAARDAPARPGALDPSLLAAGIDSIRRAFDPTNGGFGDAPKFPHPSTIELLLRRFARTHDDALLEMVTRTLLKTARGGMHDQLGGGFHRYATDPRWIVPHFEKMLYDNAGLLANYAQAFQAAGHAYFAEVARDTAEFMSAVLYDHPRGGFYGSQDADTTPGDDGSYFTWAIDEARTALSDDEFAVLVEHYHLQGRGEMHTDPTRHVLYVDRDLDVVAVLLRRDVAEIRRLLSSGREKLIAARAKRQTPYVDHACYTNWNGMAIAAFLDAFVTLGEPRYRDLALHALNRFIEQAYRPESGFVHLLGTESSSGLRMLDDQVQMANALLHASQVTGDSRYLQLARQVVDIVLRDYWTDSGFLDVPKQASGPGLDTPHIPVQDAPTPAANAVAAIVLLRLSRIFEQESYRRVAERLLQEFSPSLAPHGLFASTLLIALDDLLHEPAQITIVGSLTDPRTHALHGAALQAFRPGKIVSLHADGDRSIPFPEAVQAMIASATEPTAFVCAGTTCAPPTSDPGALTETITTFGLS